MSGVDENQSRSENERVGIRSHPAGRSAHDQYIFDDGDFAGLDASVIVGVLRSQLLTRGAYLSKNFLK
jgi:hypothetical protein